MKISSVFVVDDNISSAETVAMFVKLLYNVQARLFDDPFSCIVAAVNNAPDVVISDFLMPKMDGVALVKELRRNGVESRMIIMSCYEQVAPSIKYMLPDDVEFLLKPTCFDEVKRVVDGAFNTRELVVA